MAKTQNFIPLTIYVTPAQKMMLDGITQQKRTDVSISLRAVIDMYLRYIDKAFLHPGEKDVMAMLQKIEDRSSLANWLTRDPESTESNLTRYANNNPISLVDPLGLYARVFYTKATNSVD